MNKTFKNFLMIGLILIITVISSYIITSCSTVFHNFDYSIELYKNSYFQDKNGTSLFRFTKAERVFVFYEDKDSLSLKMIEKDNRKIELVDSSETVIYDLYAMDEDTLYVNNGNYYLYRCDYE